MKYDFKLEHNRNNSLAQIINRIKSNTKILEFGCANGRLTRYLKEEKNCSVTIVEIEETAGIQAKEFAEEYCIGKIEGNIETYEWTKKLERKLFDYIIFADVLEHLTNPEEVLKVCKNFLAEKGSIIVSIPNIGNNSILAALFQNEFEYQNIGLLDNTHIKFYTYNTFKRMLGRLDYKMVYESGTYNKMGENEIPIQFQNLSNPLKKLLLDRPFGDVYQFIFEFKSMDNEDESVHTLESVFPKNAVSYYQSVYYMKQEKNDITEFHTCRIPVRLGRNTHTVDMRNKNLRYIRFDPIDASCIIYVHSITLKSENDEHTLSIDTSNALFHNESLYFFENEDPYFELVVEDGVLQVEFELLDFGLSKETISLIEFASMREQEYTVLKNQREHDLDNFKIQAEMLSKNDADIRMLNAEVERLRIENDRIQNENERIQNENDRIQNENDRIQNENDRIQNENDGLKEQVDAYNSKFYHLNKIK